VRVPLAAHFIYKPFEQSLIHCLMLMTCRIVLMTMQVILIVVHSDGHDHDGGDDDCNFNVRIRSDQDRNIEDLQSDNDSGSIATRMYTQYKGAQEALPLSCCFTYIHGFVFYVMSVYLIEYVHSKSLVLCRIQIFLHLSSK
jgi:hypothetical protein